MKLGSFMRSHAYTGYGKATKVESILSESKLEQRVMVEGNENPKI